jgi:hypothetical protein
MSGADSFLADFCINGKGRTYRKDMGRRVVFPMSRWGCNLVEGRSNSEDEASRTRRLVRAVCICAVRYATDRDDTLRMQR